MATKTIEPEVIDVLKAARVEGNRLTLVGNLDRKMYVKVNDVIDRLGGKWSKRDKAHVFDRDVSSVLAEVLAEVLESGVRPHRNPDAFFPTPDDVIDLMIDEADLPRDESFWLLEPSAGDGRIIARVRGVRPLALVTCVEIDPVRAAKIGPPSGCVLVGDFLATELTFAVDRVLMNPPFSVPGNSDAYADHVLHAYRFLAPGGTLVSVVPRGVSGRGKAAASLRGLMADDGSMQDLRDDAFHEVGTAVRTSLIAITKPSA